MGYISVQEPLQEGPGLRREDGEHLDVLLRNHLELLILGLVSHLERVNA